MPTKNKDTKGTWKVIYTFRKNKPTTLDEALADKRCWKAVEKYTGKTIQEIQKNGSKEKRKVSTNRQPAKRRKRTA